MKFIFLTIIALLSLTSCSEKLEGEGAILSESYSISNYEDITTLSLQSGFTLTLSDDVEAGVIEISTYENIVDNIELSVSLNTISLGLNSSNIKNNLQLYARIKGSSSLNTFEASGGSCFIVEDDLSVDSSSIVLSGSSTLFGYKLSSANTYVDLSGSSTLQITCSDEISGQCSGGSLICYKGAAATNNITTSGESSVVKSE